MAKHKLLLADDSVTIQKVVNLTFADEGIEVTAVGDGDAAMQKFVESVPDLVMVDVNMPGVDGYRICEMIKQDDETKHIPVILLVGSFEPFDEEEARRVGADDFLTKPFQSIRQLVNKVSDLLNGKSTDAFNREPVVSSFDDTLEMISPVAETASTEDFGDAAMDDEMIQTSQIGSLPVNEVQKLESAPESEKFDEEDFDTETETVDENLNEVSAEEEDAPAIEFLPEETPKTEEISDELDDTADDEEDEPLPRHENIYEFANEQELEEEEEAADTAEVVEPQETEEEESELEEPEQFVAEETGTVDEEAFAAPEKLPENTPEENFVEESAPLLVEKSESTATFETTQNFELDDFDLLDLPQSKKVKNEKTTNLLEQSIVSTVDSSKNLSSEDIEAIADRVVEKMSDDVIKKIVREVFVQMTKKN